jgi:hypothetical protein
MYACIRQIGGGFFGGVCRWENQSLTFRDPPYPSIREWLYASIVPLGFRAAANLYSLLLHLVPRNKRRSG